MCLVASVSVYIAHDVKSFPYGESTERARLEGRTMSLGAPWNTYYYQPAVVSEPTTSMCLKHV